jgi:hypothetical protein
VGVSQIGWSPYLAATQHLGRAKLTSIDSYCSYETMIASSQRTSENDKSIVALNHKIVSK